MRISPKPKIEYLQNPKYNFSKIQIRILYNISSQARQSGDGSLCRSPGERKSPTGSTGSAQSQQLTPSRLIIMIMMIIMQDHSDGHYEASDDYQHEDENSDVGDHDN